MIADSQKRIHQLRSAITSDDGKITWQPESESTVPRPERRRADSLLQAWLEEVQERKETIDASLPVKKANRVGLKEIETGEMQDKALTNKVEKYDRSRYNVNVDLEALEEVAKDVEDLMR
jgi:hypothetical protein